MALLDTTVLIDLSRSKRSPLNMRAVGAMRTLLSAGDLLSTSRLNEAEFRVGIFRSTDPDAELEKVESILSTLLIREFDGSAARRYAETRATTLKGGTPQSEMDTLISAVALVHGEPILTRNVAHFNGIPGLVVLGY